MVKGVVEILGRDRRGRGEGGRGGGVGGVVFFFNDTATTEIYTLSLHDALPILEICKSYKHYDSRIRSCLMRVNTGFFQRFTMRY